MLKAAHSTECAAFFWWPRWTRKRPPEDRHRRYRNFEQTPGLSIQRTMKIKIFITACLITAAGMAWASADNVSVADVKMLAKAGMTEEIILSHIRNEHATFHLSTAEIIDLKDAGVSPKVIDYMINTAAGGPPVAAAPAREVVIASSAPAAAPAPVAVQEVAVGTTAPAVIVEAMPGAPGPDYVWVGGYWVWRHHRLGYGHWEWVPGAWTHPPYHGAVWIGGGWGPRHEWIEGRWR